MTARLGSSLLRLMLVLALVASVGAVFGSLIGGDDAAAAPTTNQCVAFDDDYTNRIDKQAAIGPVGGSRPGAIRLTHVGNQGGTGHFIWTIQQSDVTVERILVNGVDQSTTTNRFDGPQTGNPVWPVIFCLGSAARPDISLTKASTSHPDTDGDGVANTPISAPGTISYQLTATNTGNVTLTGVVISEAAVGATIGSCTPAPKGSLAPGATMRCTATQTVDAARIAAGGVVTNFATVDSLYRGTSVTAAASFRTPIADQPRIEIVKTSTSHPDGNGDGKADAPLTSPASIDYELTITNRGNVTLSDPSVSDPDLGALTCGSGIPTSLAPNASFTCTGTQTVTQQDIDDGGDIINTATATGRGGGSTVTDTDTYDIPIRQTVSIVATKTAEAPFDDADGDGTADRPAEVDDVIDYVVTVTNTGNVDVTISVTDTTVTLTCASTTLAPAASTDCTGSYTVEQDDVDQFQPIANTATATATGPGGAIGRSVAGYLVPVLDRSELEVRKISTSHPSAVPGDRVSENGLTAAGDVDFRIEVENTGSTTIDAIELVDIVGVTGCGETIPFSLAPGEIVSCDYTVAVDQTDFDTLPGLVNIAVADGTDAGGNEVAAGDFFIVPFERRQAVELTKVARAPFGDAEGNSVADSPINAPQTVTYDLVAENTGNVTVDDVEITDAVLGALSCTPSQPASLAPGDTLECSATRDVTQTDIDNAFPIPNAALVTVGGVVADRAAYVIPVDAVADLTFTKTSSTHPDADGDGTADDSITAAETVDYVLTAQNTGDVTLFGVTITDPLLPSLTCGPVTLLPTQELTCDETDGATYDVGQPEIDAGLDLFNTATATSTDIHGEPVDRQASYDIPIDGTTDAELAKTALAPFGDADGNGIADTKIDAPQTLTYQLVATNTGTTTLTDVEIVDSILGTLSCDRTAPVSLAPTESLTCTATRDVTQTDIDNGFPIPNAAFVSEGGAVLDRDAYVILVERNPGLTMSKSSPTSSITGSGPVDYLIEVTNTGNTTLTDVVIDDPMLSGCTAFQVGVLAPNATATCTDTFDVSQARVDAGGNLTNTATAAGNAGGRLVKDQATSKIPIEQNPELTVSKAAEAPFDDADDDGIADTPAIDGDDIDYVVIVTNTGNVTVGSISADDTITALTCVTDSLAPTQSTTCTGTYSVDQTDVDALTPIRNIATITGTSPSGQSVSAADAYLVPVLVAPELLVRKSIPSNPDTDGDFVGDFPLTGPGTIDYEIAIANGGSVSLTDIDVVDSLLPLVTCPGGTPFDLAVGDAVTCTGSYSVNQAEFDVNPGIVNIAIAAGTDPGDGIVSGAWIAAVAFEHRPEIELEKTSITHPDGDGDGIADDPLTGSATVEYRLEATNAGNVTLTDVVVTDPMLPTLSCTAATLPPGDSVVCTGSLDVDQDTIDLATDIVNQAMAAGDYAGTTYTDRATYDIPLSVVTSLSLDKTSTSHPDADADGVADSAITGPATITYRLTATNDGTTTLRDVEIADPDVPRLSCTPAAPATLLPGDSLVCTGSRTADQADIDAGADIVNTATVSGSTVFDGQVITASDSYAVPIDTMPDLAITKLPETQTFLVGESVTLQWTIALTNTGNVTLTDLTLEDALFDADTDELIGLDSCSRTVASLAPGATTSVPCSVSRTMTASEVANIAVVDAASLAGPVTAGAVALVEVESLPPTTVPPTTVPPTTTLPVTLPPTGGGGSVLPAALALLIAGVALTATTRRRHTA